MSEPPETMHVLTPSFRPMGGVIKIFDYATHALSLGYHVSIWCPEEYSADLPIFRIERFRDLKPDGRLVNVHRQDRLGIGPGDLAFISLPRNHDVVYRSLPPGSSPERIIHIVQNVRHITPLWEGGQPLRLLSRPMARISTNQIVHDAVAPHTEQRSLHRIIPLGHDLGYFHRDRTGGLGHPLRVAYTTWKSDLGDRVAAAVGHGDFEFRAVRDNVTWEDLRSLYHWADVFLCCPNAEEGFYMPGLEAMEAGAMVVTPDVGGNMAYCRPDENCVLVPFEDVQAYATALLKMLTWSTDEVERRREVGYASCAPFSLDRERVLFGEYLDELWPRIRRFEQEARSA